MSNKKQHAIAGSERAPMPGAREAGPASPNQNIEVTLRLRSRAGKQPLFEAETANQLPAQRKVLTREQFESIHGADPASIAKVEAFAREHGLTVEEKSEARRTVVLSGTVAAMSAAFGVKLKEYDHPGGRYRGRTGPVHVSDELNGIVEGVFGLDNRPQAKPHFRRRREEPGIRAHAVSTSFTPLQIAELYDFPTDADGSDECIGLIELGGGFEQGDLTTYFKALGLKKHPKVSAVSVNKAKNSPTGDPDGPDGEVMLDIEVAGAVAPGAKIVVYFAPNTDAGFLNAITTAVHDKSHKPSVISISWGGPESEWTGQAMTSMDEAFQAAAAVGVTVCVASGDNGAGDGETDKLNHVDFPASSPFALACGGTLLKASGDSITSETVWNESTGGATGGGISDQFPLPSYQNGAGVPPSANPGKRIGRGVPDVAGDADPASGYDTRVDGQDSVIGGTSAVAPLWAGLISLINESLGKPAGFINPLLYQGAGSSGGFNDVVSGNNGAYSAKKGWDACTGLGTPVGTGIAKLLGAPTSAKVMKKTGTTGS